MVDPRSKEFKNILVRLSKALNFLRLHDEFRDSDVYLRWLEQLQLRATSKVARAMLDLLDNAKKACVSKQLRKSPSFDAAGAGGGGGTGHAGEPLESSAVYQKFRGLGYRMRELAALLAIDEEKGAEAGAEGADAATAGDASLAEHTAHRQVRQAYVLIRCELLTAVVRETSLTQLARRQQELSKPQATAQDATESASSALGLCLCIRQSFALLLRLAQLEFQLFESMFNLTVEDASSTADNSLSSTPLWDSPSPSAPGDASVPSSHPLTLERRALGFVDSDPCPEVSRIVAILSSATADSLRPLLIHEAEVDSLCRVVTALAEDVKSQILALKLPRVVLKSIMSALDCTVTDAQERLVYCAELRLRNEVEQFEPLHSQLSYPDILEVAVADSKGSKLRSPSHASGSGSGGNGSSKAAAPPIDDIVRTWYPPLRHTLGLLSKLYGVVDRLVFEDFARRAVSLCVRTLRAGADGVRRSRSQLHADLFLVRHLLILREQLLPFDVRLTSVGWSLDFAPTGHALSNAVTNSNSWLRFDAQNALLHLAREGLPGLHEVQVDGKRELDVVLKTACAALKQSAVKSLLGALEAFLAKVSAFVGEVPCSTVEGDEGAAGEHAAWSKASSSGLLGQAFVRPDRIRELLQSAVQTAGETCPDFRRTLQVRQGAS